MTSVTSFKHEPVTVEAEANPTAPGLLERR